MLEKINQIENIQIQPKFDLEKLLQEKKVSPEITKIIQENKYLPKALQLTQENLDDYQLTHVLSIAEKTGAIPLELLSPEDNNRLIPASIIHDVGKAKEKNIIALVKSEKKFKPEEHKKTQEHVRLMVKWAEENGVPEEITAIAARHHEFIEKETAKKNGLNGYPRNNGERRTSGNRNDKNYENRQNNDRRNPKLNTGQIDRLGHILHIVDEFDANRQPRSYKPPCSPTLCRKILTNRFPSPEDKKIIDALIRLEENKN